MKVLKAELVQQGATLKQTVKFHLIRMHGSDNLQVIVAQFMTQLLNAKLDPMCCSSCSYHTNRLGIEYWKRRSQVCKSLVHSFDEVEKRTAALYVKYSECFRQACIHYGRTKVRLQP